jgi:16S rRNA (guanine527-N7)-methyltransferase
MSGSTATRLNSLLVEAGLPILEPTISARFEAYLSLILHWNKRMNLTSIRDEDGILRRHFGESIACAAALPGGISTLLDIGSGAGFPGIPIALCRPEIRVTLAESQGKKAAFLREAARVLELSVEVYAGRAETLAGPFGCVALRAVDRMSAAVEVGAGLLASGGWLALMIGGADLDRLKAAAGAGMRWNRAIPLPGKDRLLVLGTPEALVVPRGTNSPGR